MSFSQLPPELLTSIFEFVTPDALLHLCLTSSTCHEVIERHSEKLCHTIASRHALTQYPHLHSIPPVQWLQIRWHRHQLNSALASKVNPADLGWWGRHADLVPAFRYALDILWTCHDAMSGRIVDLAEDPLKSWVNTTTLENIDVMTMHVSVYAGMLMRLSHRYGLGGADPAPVLEMALTRGIPFLVRLLVDGEEEAGRVIGEAYASGGSEVRAAKSAVQLLGRERDRKVEGIETLLGVDFERAGRRGGA